MKNSETYIDLIIAACKKVNDFTLNIDRENFIKNQVVQSAVLMQLQVIGEISKKIVEEIRNKVDVPWKLIMGLRDIISHDYFSIELDMVWDIVKNNIPQLEKNLLLYLENNGEKYMPPYDDVTPILN